MAQNIFAGGPHISEIPPDRSENKEINEVSQINAIPGAGLYKPFQDRVDPSVDADGIENAFFDIPNTAPVGAEEDQITLPEEVVGAESTERTANNEQVNIQIQELPETPFIQRLTEKGPSDEPGIISPEIARGLQESIIAGQSFSEALAQTDIPADIKSVIQDRWEGMNDPETAKQNQETFEKDYGKDFPHIQDKEGNFPDARTEEAFHMVGSAYLVGESHNPAEQQAALDMAFKTALNNAIEGKQFERSITFQENTKILQKKDVNPNEGMDAFISVLKIIDTDQGSKAEKTNENTDVDAMIEEAELVPEFQKAKEAVETSERSGNETAVERAQTELRSIIEQAEEITGTPIGTFSMVLERGEIDAGQETSPQTV